MTATKIRQEAATEIAGERNFRVEVHQQAGDCWDVRLYTTASGYVKNSYNRKRDVAKANIGDAIMKMLDEMAPEATEVAPTPEPKTNSFAVMLLRALNTKRATLAQLKNAHVMLVAEYDSLSEANRNGSEGHAYELAIRTVHEEITARGH